MPSMAAIEAKIKEFLSDGANQMRHPYELAERLIIEIRALEHDVVGEEPKAVVADKTAIAKPKLTKAELVAKMQAGKAAKRAAKLPKLEKGEKWDATAAATKEAKDKGVNMAEVEGSGAGGTVVKSDVTEHAAQEAISGS